MANWLTRFLNRGETRTISGADYWIPIPTVSGTVVNEDTALTVTAFFSGVNVLSTSVALFDFNVVKKVGRGKTVDDTHPIQELIHHAPNEDLTAFSFRQSMMGHICTHGNAYAEIVRDRNADPVELILLDPRKVTPKRAPDHRLYYDVEGRSVLPENMLHVAGWGFDGIVGYNPIRYAREALGLAMATEKFGASVFGNSAIPKGIWKSTKAITQKAQEDFREQLNRTHQGPFNANKMMFVPNGWDFESTSLPPEDAQFLQTRRFQIEEIARLLNIPPHKLQALENAHYNNIEQMNIDFYQTSLLPWLVKIENEFNKKLFTYSERKVWSVEHDMRNILRADMQAKSAYFTSMFNIGVYSVNEIRELEYLNPIEDGDNHYVPLNMQAVESEVTEPDQDDNEQANPALPSGPVEDVQATALNRAQIESLLEVVTAVTSGQLPGEAAKAVMAASFPMLSSDQVNGIVDPLVSFTPKVQGDANEASSQTQQDPNPEPDRAALEAVRGVVLEAVARMVRRETSALRAALKKGAYTDRVAALSDFYVRHRPIVLEALRPALRAYEAVSGVPVDPRDFASLATGESHVSALIAQDRLGDLEGTLDTWDQSRADEIISKLDSYREGGNS